MAIAITWMLLGFVALIVGGELLVRGSSRLAALAGISPLVIGLTVVSFGTSSPELAVSLKANLMGQADVAVGNVVGSNIFNVLLVLGASALVSPLLVASQLIRFDVPIMIGASILLIVFGWDGSVGRLEGLILFAGLILYLGRSVTQGRKEKAEVRAEFEQEFRSPPPRTLRYFLVQLCLIVIGVVLLTFGSNLLVVGASKMATVLGMSELLIGLTIVATGTSLPELAASIVASYRGERDIAVGNVVGSNIFNILCVIGLSASVAPSGVLVDINALQFDIPIMIAVAIGCLPIFMTGHRIERWEGGIFVAYYFAYATYLVLDAVDSTITSQFGVFMIVFMIPLTVLAIGINLLRAVWTCRRSR